MGLKLNTAPATLAVSVADMKAHLRVDTSAEDTLIQALIESATRKVEDFTHKRLINQTWEYWLDHFPTRSKERWWDGVKEIAISEILAPQDFIKIPLSPLSSVTSLSTFNRDNTEVTFSASNYFIDNVTDRVVLNDGQVWPSNLRNRHAVKVVFVAGYGAASSDVPATLREAVKQLTAHMYEHRGDEEATMPGIVRDMIFPYRDRVL